MPRLSDKAIFEGDENRSEESGGCSTLETAHREIRERDGSNAQDGGHHSHRDIWYVFIDPAITGLRLIIPSITDRIRELT